MKLFIRILLPLLVLAAGIWGARYLIQTKPEPKSYTARPQITQVEATRLHPRSFPIILESRGTVRPRTTTNLIPEVSGQVIEISPHFRAGGFFDEGEELLKIDPLDYQTAIVVAESNAAQARTALEEEKIRGQQALDNWRRLGKSGTPSEMVLRVPQLAEAKARLAAAEAEVVKAKRNLERTVIRAPYAGRTEEQLVDVGQYVSPGTVLGKAFATDVMEVRLPLTNHQLAFINLPEERERDQDSPAAGPEVGITSRIGREESVWRGKIVRVDSAVDRASRQLFVVAEVEDPYRRKSAAKGSAEHASGPPLHIGMFVDANIQGVKLNNVFVLPRSSVRVGGEVILIETSGAERSSSR